jgi:RNA polymerase sigma-70 factor, ECF subfamily
VREGLAEFVPHVYRLALRLTGDRHRAEDLTQETFLRAWKRRDQLKEGRALRIWLLKIAANLWTDELRRSRSPAAPVSLPEVEIACDAATPDRTAEAKESLEQALRLLDSLPVRQRTVLYLTAVEELSSSEVADVLGIDKNTAKVHLSLARKKMREQIDKTTVPPKTEAKQSTEKTRGAEGVSPA